MGSSSSSSVSSDSNEELDVDESLGLSALDLVDKYIEEALQVKKQTTPLFLKSRVRYLQENLVKYGWKF